MGDTMDMVSMVDMVFGDVRRGKLKPNLPPKPLPNLVTSMAMDMDLDMDTMADTTDSDIVVTMDTDIFGDVRRGKLKPTRCRTWGRSLPLLWTWIWTRLWWILWTWTWILRTWSWILRTWPWILWTPLLLGKINHRSTKPIINILPQSALMETMTTLAFVAGLILSKFPCVKFD